MGIKQPDENTVVEAVHATFRKLYGEDIVTVLLWLPPGEERFNFATNGDPAAIINSLRAAADNLELGPVVAIHRIPPAGH